MDARLLLTVGEVDSDAIALALAADRYSGALAAGDGVWAQQQLTEALSIEDSLTHALIDLPTDLSAVAGFPAAVMEPAGWTILAFGLIALPF